MSGTQFNNPNMLGNTVSLCYSIVLCRFAGIYSTYHFLLYSNIEQVQRVETALIALNQTSRRHLTV